MGRGDDGMKCIEVRTLMKRGAIDDAMDVVETINTDKVQSIVDLKLIANVLERAGEYRRAKEVMLQSYEIKRTKLAVYRLTYLSVKTNDFNDAEAYYREFVEMAPNSPDRYILRYGIDRAKNVDYVSRIATLKKLKQIEYTEEWGYELAKIYHKAGLDDDCIQECHDLMIYFGDGVIVDKARLLCRYHEEGRQSLDEYGLFEDLTPEELEANRARYMSDTGDFSAHIPEIEAQYDLHNQEVKQLWEDTDISQNDFETERLNHILEEQAKEAEEKLTESLAQVMEPSDSVYEGAEMKEILPDPTLDELYQHAEVRDAVEEKTERKLIDDYSQSEVEAEVTEDVAVTVEEKTEDTAVEEGTIKLEPKPQGKHARRNARRAAKRKARKEAEAKMQAEELMAQPEVEEIVAKNIVEETEASFDAAQAEDTLAQAVEEVMQEDASVASNVNVVVNEEMMEAIKEEKVAEAKAVEEVNEVEGDVSEEIAEEVAEVSEEVEDEASEEEYEPNFYDTYGMLLWGYFQRYQEDTRLCEEVYEALERCMNGTRPMNFVLTCKSRERYVEFAKELAKAMQALGLTEKTQVARISAEKLNHIHLEQKYDGVEGGFVLVEEARKMTADTAQSIMNMINDMDGKVVVLLCDARPYMKDLMDEYRILKKYFPFDVSMK